MMSVLLNILLCFVIAYAWFQAGRAYERRKLKKNFEMFISELTRLDKEYRQAYKERLEAEYKLKLARQNLKAGEC